MTMTTTMTTTMTKRGAMTGYLSRAGRVTAVTLAVAMARWLASMMERLKLAGAIDIIPSDRSQQLTAASGNAVRVRLPQPE